MVKISKFGEDFLLLALRIDKHIEGYVDFYIGPEKLHQIVDSESLASPNTLYNDSNNLIKQVGAQGYDKERERYIEKLLVAMKTSIEILNGSDLPIKDRFKNLYDVDLQPAKEAELDKLKEEFEAAYEGAGSLEERMNKLRITRKVPEAKVYPLFKKALSITRMKTKELFGDLLPNKERILIELVKENNNSEAKWAYYEWYIGNFRSRIELNPKYNMYWTAFLSAAAHEGYPGHHMNFVLNEQKLYKELNHFEHSILLLKSPKLVICEGIADLAVNALYSYREQAEISLQFCLNGTKEDIIENLAMQNTVKAKRSLIWYNIAYHALIDEWSEKKLIQYATNFEILSQKNIKNILKLIFDPAHSTTAFVYNLGSRLIMNKYGEFPSVKNFRNILLNPFLPSDFV